MSKIFSIIVFVFFYLTASSQQTIHAKWYYGEAAVWNPTTQFTYQFTFEKDTVIKGKLCSMYSGPAFACSFTQDHQFIYAQDDKIFFYEAQLDTFEMLYDFSAIAGEEYSVMYHAFPGLPADTAKIKIDSLGFVTINNVQLRKQYVHYYLAGSSINYLSTLIERIGDINQFFNLTTDYMACDVDFPTGLRCFEDTILGLYHADTLDCNYSTSLQETGLANQQNRIVPNPATSFITLENIEFKNFQYVVYNALGKELMKGTNDNCIFIGDLANGLYIIGLKDLNSGQTNTIKFEKNN